MKKWMKAALSGLVAIALTVGMLAYLTELVEQKTSYDAFGALYEQEAPTDVLFVGSSHVLRGILPMELWQDEGIVSYNLAYHSNVLPVMYWVLRDYIELSEPKLVVIDCYHLSLDLKTNIPVETIHNTVDLLPLTYNKLGGIIDLLDGTGYGPEFVWDFVRYHDRWRELTANDFLPATNVTKNGAAGTGIGVPLQFEMLDTSVVQEEDTAGVVYLRKMIEECRSRDIEVLLIYLPFPADDVKQKEANRTALIAEEYGVNYINFLQNGTVNYDMDMEDSNVGPYNANGHLNFSGASKVTEYLGEYIKENYAIADRREDPEYASWYDDYNVYQQYKINLFNAQTALENLLVVCRDKHHDYCIYLTPDVLAMENEVFYLLLENLGIERGALRMDMPTLAVVDNTGGGYFCLSPGETLETSFGVVSFEPRDGLWCVSANGVDILTADGGTAAEITAIDPATDAVAAKAVFGIRQAAIEKR